MENQIIEKQTELCKCSEKAVWKITDIYRTEHYVCKNCYNEMLHDRKAPLMQSIVPV